MDSPGCVKGYVPVMTGSIARLALSAQEFAGPVRPASSQQQAEGGCGASAQVSPVIWTELQRMAYQPRGIMTEAPLTGALPCLSTSQRRRRPPPRGRKVETSGYWQDLCILTVAKVQDE